MDEQAQPVNIMHHFGTWLQNWAHFALHQADQLPTEANDDAAPSMVSPEIGGDDAPPAHWLAHVSDNAPPEHWLAMLRENGINWEGEETAVSHPSTWLLNGEPIDTGTPFAWLPIFQQGLFFYLHQLGLPFPEAPIMAEEPVIDDASDYIKGEPRLLALAQEQVAGQQAPLHSQQPEPVAEHLLSTRADVRQPVAISKQPTPPTTNASSTSAPVLQSNMMPGSEHPAVDEKRPFSPSTFSPTPTQPINEGRIGREVKSGTVTPPSIEPQVHTYQPRKKEPVSRDVPSEQDLSQTAVSPKSSQSSPTRQVLQSGDLDDSRPNYPVLPEAIPAHPVMQQKRIERIPQPSMLEQSSANRKQAASIEQPIPQSNRPAGQTGAVPKTQPAMSMMPGNSYQREAKVTQAVEETAVSIQSPIPQPTPINPNAEKMTAPVSNHRTKKTKHTTAHLEPMNHATQPRHLEALSPEIPPIQAKMVETHSSPSPNNSERQILTNANQQVSPTRSATTPVRYQTPQRPTENVHQEAFPLNKAQSSQTVVHQQIHVRYEQPVPKIQIQPTALPSRQRGEQKRPYSPQPATPKRTTRVAIQPADPQAQPVVNQTQLQQPRLELPPVPVMRRETAVSHTPASTPKQSSTPKSPQQRVPDIQQIIKEASIFEPAPQPEPNTSQPKPFQWPALPKPPQLVNPGSGRRQNTTRHQRLDREQRGR